MLLAAGSGSRYGGVKPVAPVGPDGEPLIAIAVEQAVAAGFADVVVVVGASTEAAVAAALTGFGSVARLVRQAVPALRSRPWGTVDALLCAPVEDAAAVANGDDLYGVAALASARHWLDDRGIGRADGAAVLFALDRTLSNVGGVSRAEALCDGGRLRSVREQRGVHFDDVVVVSGDGTRLDRATPVSMNLWCFNARALARLRDMNEGFISAHMNDAMAEHGIPNAVDALLREGFVFDGLHTDSTWHGVTWADDVARVRAQLTAEVAGRARGESAP